jgi:2-polyprenyl-6-methoxyphenol hydroxylase-like FAD-dependent oxidoreductase
LPIEHRKIFTEPVEFAYMPFDRKLLNYEAPRMISRSAVLIGDAAFVARPHTAMGVSKAAGDVMALSNCLAVGFHAELSRLGA